MDSYEIPLNRYELIINIRFLGRGLFPMIQDGIKPGSFLVFESFVDREEDEFCLKQNESLCAFQSFHIAYYEEKKANHSEKID